MFLIEGALGSKTFGFSRRYGVAGGEQVPTATLGWYSIFFQKIISQQIDRKYQEVSSPSELRFSRDKRLKICQVDMTPPLNNRVNSDYQDTRIFAYPCCSIILKSCTDKG